MKKLGFVFALFFVTALFFGQTSLAANFDSSAIFPSWTNGRETAKVTGVIGENGDLNLILQYVPPLLNIIMKIVAPIVLVMFVLSGMRFIAANGKDEDLTKAKALFSDGFLGLIWIAVSYSIVKGIYFFFAT